MRVMRCIVCMGHDDRDEKFAPSVEIRQKHYELHSILLKLLPKVVVVQQNTGCLLTF